MKSLFILCSLASALLLSGCGTLGNLYVFRGYGFLYTHTVEPLTSHREPVQAAYTGKALGDRKEIQIQYVGAVWDYNAIGAVAKKAGIKTIHYADLETREILFGLWSRQIVHIYGEAETSGIKSVSPRQTIR